MHVIVILSDFLFFAHVTGKVKMTFRRFSVEDMGYVYFSV